MFKKQERVLTRYKTRFSEVQCIKIIVLNCFTVVLFCCCLPVCLSLLTVIYFNTHVQLYTVCRKLSIFTICSVHDTCTVYLELRIHVHIVDYSVHVWGQTNFAGVTTFISPSHLIKDVHCPKCSQVQILLSIFKSLEMNVLFA